MDEKRKEWDALSESERNCLMWPDFLVWKQAPNVKICRKDPDDSLGLVSVTVQDEDTKLYYNVTKFIKENHPAHGHINPCEWIFKVDGTTTTDCPSNEFSRLIRNGKNEVHLSIKRPVNSLAEFVKKWGEEKTVTLKLSQDTDFHKRCRFVHFYSKDDSGNTKDRILVWEAKPGTSELNLQRGEELLAVNGQPVEGKLKKLAQIYKLILDQAQAADVELKIKTIQSMHSVEETLLDTDTDVQLENHLSSPDTSLLEDKQDSVFDEPTQCLVVEKEMDMNAGQTVSENHVNNSALADGEIESSESEKIEQPQADPPDSKKKPRKPRLPSLRRRLSSSNTQNENPANEKDLLSSVKNEAYTPTPPTQRKTLLCGTCVMKNVTKLPADRNSWPIHKIENGCFGYICKLLDLERSTVSLLSALECFSVNDADSIKQQFPSGRGIAKKALDRWGTLKKENNVEALKKIVQEKMERMDVVEEIENWEKLHVCHGCGVKLSQS